MAIVFDERGSLEGLVTFEDLSEAILGQISDEYDPIENRIERVNQFKYIVSGEMPIDRFNRLFNANFTSENYRSIGGLLIDLEDNIPGENDVLTHEEFRFSSFKRSYNLRKRWAGSLEIGIGLIRICQKKMKWCICNIFT